MAALMVAGTFISVTFRSKLRRVIPYFTALVACVLILRGLNVGIPYVSPVMPGTTTVTVIGCHPDSAIISTIRQ